MKLAIDAPAKMGRLTSSGARFPAALRLAYTAIPFAPRPVPRPAVPAPWRVLAGPLRLTLSRPESVTRSGMLLRRRIFMTVAYPAAQVATAIREGARGGDP